MFSQETISRVKKSNYRGDFPHTRSKGNIGEDIACVYLKKNHFSIVVRNYLKKWGELDIVAKKEGILHFFEVKSVTCSGFERFKEGRDAKGGADIHRPEENVHPFKIRHIRRMIQTYMADCGAGLDAEFYFHVLCVFMDLETRKARVKWIKDLVV